MILLKQKVLILKPEFELVCYRVWIFFFSFKNHLKFTCSNKVIRYTTVS